MIIYGLPNEDRAEKKIQDIALYIINKKTEGRWPKLACRQTSKDLWYIVRHGEARWSWQGDRRSFFPESLHLWLLQSMASTPDLCCGERKWALTHHAREDDGDDCHKLLAGQKQVILLWKSGK